MAQMHGREPIEACPSSSCRECPTQGVIHCHFMRTDWLWFVSAALPGFIIAGLGLYRVPGPWLGVWLALIFVFFGFVEIRVLCSHCPHYAEKGLFLTCWANYGAPKIWKYRPGPMSRAEKTVMLGGFGLVWGLPALVLAWQSRWSWLIAFDLATIVFFMFLRLGFCPRCMNLACPLNRVAGKTGKIFPARNL